MEDSIGFFHAPSLGTTAWQSYGGLILRSLYSVELQWAEGISTGHFEKASPQSVIDYRLMVWRGMNVGHFYARNSGFGDRIGIVMVCLMARDAGESRCLAKKQVLSAWLRSQGGGRRWVVGILKG
jgi:hypothetical protein